LPLGFAFGARARTDSRFFGGYVVRADQRVERVQHVEHARVFDAIIDTQAIFAIFEDARAAEEHQLLRNVCLPLM
jgi:hypothetical protein